MDGDDDGVRAAVDGVNGIRGRLSLSRRFGSGHHRTKARVSLGSLARSRRRDKEPKSLLPRSPTRRITLGGAMREDGMSAGGAVRKGRHGIRYERTHSDTWLEDIKTEVSEDQAATTIPTSSSLGQIAGTIAEEGGIAAAFEEGSEEARHDTKAAAAVADDAGESDNNISDSYHSSSSVLPTGQRQSPLRAQAQTDDMSVIAGFGSGGAIGGAPVGQVSPASDYRRGSMSPGMPMDARARTQSWTAAAANSPPVLRGPFSRARSRSRSPRHRLSMNLGVLAGGVPFSRKLEHARLSSGGISGGGGAAMLSNNPSVASAGETGVSSWNDGDDGGTSGDVGGEEEDGEGMGPGPFTEACLEMARLRLPQMESGFEEDGFFGIDVRSLIIGREIARGAYGVVHEGKLLCSQPKSEGVDGEAQSAATTGEAESGASGSPKGEKDGDTPPTAGGAETAEGGAAAQEQPVDDVAKKGGQEGEGGGGGGGSDEEESGARSVAVKIQQVPVDEEEQANLLGELAMLRQYKHPHLVEFIGTAMAMERGSDTVMVAMELCTNGALREALKLNIGWPLKVRMASDMTDGLQYLHQHGIIHRDIKTPNVLIDSFWRAKLCDYNFAIDENSSIKQEFCAGTAEFMSPEVLLSEEYGLPSDVFSLGMIFVEMLTGQEPSPTFPERPPQNFFVVSEEEIEGQLLPDAPSSFGLLESQCLFAEPAERPTAEDAFNWLQDLVNETGEENVALPQRGPPLPVLTEGAAIAREGNVINASPKGNEPQWLDADTMGQQIESMVESAVDRALAERQDHQHLGLVSARGMGDGEESASNLDEMKEEMHALRAACEERDNRISDLEVQALRNTSTLKMLSSALEVAYKMLEAQQATLSHTRSASSLPDDPQTDESTAREGFSLQDSDDFEAVEARLSQVGPNP